MALIKTVAPSGDVVSADELYAHLRVDLVGGAAVPDDAADIAALHAAAVDHLDGDSGVLQRALLTQQWTLTLDAFPASISIPLPPLQSVQSVTYIDGADVTQTLPVSDYIIVNNGAAASEIVPAFGVTWPTAKAIPQAVSVGFTCGYGAAGAVPAALKQAIKLLVGEWYCRREASSESVLTAIPQGVATLIEPYKVVAP